MLTILEKGPCTFDNRIMPAVSVYLINTGMFVYRIVCRYVFCTKVCRHVSLLSYVGMLFMNYKDMCFGMTILAKQLFPYAQESLPHATWTVSNRKHFVNSERTIILIHYFSVYHRQPPFFCSCVWSELRYGPIIRCYSLPSIVRAYSPRPSLRAAVSKTKSNFCFFVKPKTPKYAACAFIKIS